jgi:hypothetical protein
MMSDYSSFIFDRSKLRSFEYFLMYYDVTSSNFFYLASLFSPSYFTFFYVIYRNNVFKIADSHFLKMLDWF